MLLFPEDRFITVNNCQIRYWDEGQHTGPCLLLLHGIGASVEYFHANFAELAKHYRVVALDMPGFGKSDKPDAPYDLNYFSTFVGDFCKTMQLQDLFVLGHSLGGAIALKFSADNLSQVRKLISIDGVGFSTKVIIFFRLMGRPLIGKFFLNLSKPMFAKALRANVFNSNVITDELIDVLYPLTQNEETQKVIRQITKYNTSWLGMRKRTIEPLWNAMPSFSDLPVKVFWGEQDLLLPTAKHVPNIAQHIPHAEIELLDHCGHIPQMEHPQVFNEKLLEFLQRPV